MVVLHDKSRQVPVTRSYLYLATVKVLLIITILCLKCSQKQTEITLYNRSAPSQKNI